MTRILHIGRLSTNSWPGSITAEDVYIDIAELSTKLDGYYVSVNASAKTRCIDGRHDPEFDENHLGPQMPGGVTGAALAYRLGVDKNDLTKGTFYSDFEAMLDTYLRLGLTPGGHRDDTDREHGVGCGAIDGIETILATMTDKHYVEDHKRLTRIFLDTAFNRDNYLRVLGAGLVLSSHGKEYFATRGDTLTLMEQKSPGCVSTLEGVHNEKIVLVNFVPETTFASNRFALDNGGIQAFGYDVWRSMQLADMVLPETAENIERERFIMARVMLTIATLMALTDGSQQLLFRLP